MADIELRSSRSGRRMASPRIDLTPMVDLGFLLLTFFMMTTTLSKPRAMDIQMPYTPSETHTEFYASSAITLIPARDHRIYYYEGAYDPSVTLNEIHTERALRALLQQKQQALMKRAEADERDLQVLIKPHVSGTVADIVALFDEMNILKVKYVAMVDIYPGEEQLVDRLLADKGQ